MSTVSRGVRGVFRNTVRTSGVVIILALSVGLALVMLLALKTVQSKIASVKSSIGNTVSISPAGFSNFSSANNVLTTSELAKVSTLPHVTGVAENITGRLSTIGSSSPQPFGQSSDSNTNDTTSLTSAINLSDLKSGSGGGGGGGAHFEVNGSAASQLPANFSLPVSAVGTNDPSSLNGAALTITSGKTLDGSKDTNTALVSTAMATKNNLKVGSTFQAYSANFTVAGIFDSGTQGGNNTVIFTLPTLQRLTSQGGDVTSATATIDSVDNLASATTAIKNSLGTSTADVQNAQQQAETAIAPLQNIETISTYSLIGSLVAGSIIIFLTMLMIVRERRREIGVLKAIGSSNIKIVVQFMSEALTLTGMAAILGMIAGVALSNPILSVLTTSTSTSGGGGGGGFARGGGGGGGGFARFAGAGGRAIQNLHAVVGFDILLYGLAAAFVIAIVGSALPAFMIAKVRPAEVMRGE